MVETRSRFSYYDRLSAKNKAIYRRSDAVTQVALPEGAGLQAELRVAAAAAARALDAGKPSLVRTQAQKICDLITSSLGTERVAVKVLRVRPQRSFGELHGLYTRDDGAEPALRVWMRTAQRADVVRPRTLLRTLVHELCHHLDYAHYRLGESFHNPGFFSRESSLMRLLTPDGRAGTGFEAASVPRAPEPSADAPSAAPDQLRLPGF
jgi:hypothetical protein